jgi:hypothetical protein
MFDEKLNIRFFSILLVSGILLAFDSIKKIKRKIEMKNISKQLLSSASAGSVEIEGVSWPFRAIHNSMQGQKVVFRQVIIQQYVRRGKRGSWQKVWEKNSSEQFMVFDQSGFAIINPGFETANLVIEEIPKSIYRAHQLTPAQHESFHDFYDNSLFGFSTSLNQGWLLSIISSSAKYRIVERSIPLGSPLFIYGYLIPDDTFRFVHLKEDHAHYNKKMTKFLVNKNYMKPFFDKSRDGIVDDVELKKGFQSAISAMIKKDLGITDLKQNGESTEKVYGTIGANLHQKLHLADCFEEQLLRAKPLYLNWLQLYLGGFLVATAIYILVKAIS